MQIKVKGNKINFREIVVVLVERMLALLAGFAIILFLSSLESILNRIFSLLSM